MAISNKAVIKILLILALVTIIFSVFAWIIPAYVPQIYITTFFMVLGGCSAIIAIMKLVKGSSKEDLLDCLKSRDLQNSIKKVDKLSYSDDYDDIFKNIKELCEAMKDDFAEER